MKRYICIHGHFYQPPRENPWLETVEIQDSARPYHDWNERIAAECYAPNTTARIMDADGLINRIVNNYRYISFNFGPTLSSWMEKYSPDAWQLIRDADAASVADHDGHGNALAQVYNHMILPLARPRDQETQVVWGIKDFEHRFGRRPEGMWLAETAADHASLAMLAAHGIKFTVLAPGQCARARPRDRQGETDAVWTEMQPDAVDPRQPYRISLEGGRHIDVFFYDSPISRGIAFENLLQDGTRLAARLLGAFDPDRESAQLVHIATDGESYGHHASLGEMGLAFALNLLTASDSPVQVTNYGEFLSLFPPRFEADIYQPSSWSCCHGVGRWSDNCGCTSRSDWHQRWRAPLRAALDWLRDQLDPFFEERAGALLEHPWQARNDYIEVLLDRRRSVVDGFLGRYQKRELDEAETTTLVKLFEMQRHGMLMYTSCGWFFDDISRLEGVQILRYAARAIQLARELGLDVEEDFVHRLERAPSNVADFQNGAGVWEKQVATSYVDLRRVVAHYAIRSLVDRRADEEDLFSYHVVPLESHADTFGETGWALGRVTVTSSITYESMQASYAVLHFGVQDFHCCVGDAMHPEVYQDVRDALTRAYHRYSMTQLLRIIDRQFGEDFYTIKDLLADDRRRILVTTMKDVLARYDSSYRNLFDQSVRMIQYLAETGTPPPVEFLAAASYVVRSDLEKALSTPDGAMSPAAMTALRRSQRWGIPLDIERMELMLRRSLESTARELLQEVELDRVARMGLLLDFADAMPVKLVLREIQNYLDETLRRHGPELVGDPDRSATLDALLALARRCHLNTQGVLEVVATRTLVLRGSG